MRILSLFILLFSIHFSFAQTYGNEWIKYNQKYYKFNIIQTGIYKLDFATISNAGIPISTLSSHNLQIFGKEKEVPLFIEDGGDDTLNSGDYILFFAERNSGWLDSTLYENPTDIGNPAYSLFNDTLQYFFTWNNLTNNSRFIIENDTDFNNYTPSNFILQKVETSYSSIFNEGQREDDESSSFYMPGEGWGSGQYGSGTTLNLSANTSSLYTGSDAPSAIFNGISVTKSNANYTGVGNHHTIWQIGSNNFVLHDEIVTGWRQIYSNTLFPISELNNGSTSLKWMMINDQGAVTDFQALNYWSIKYPKTPSLENSSFTIFSIKNNPLETKIRLDFTNVNYNNPIIFVFGDSPKKISLTNNTTFYSTLISNNLTNQEQKVVYQNLNTISSLTTLTPVNGTGLFTNYPSFNADGALLMIYHQKLDSASLEYADYRNSVAGGHYNVILANIDELYLQFGGGINKHINGIRRFAHYIYNNASVKPVGLFLLGKALSSGYINANSSTAQIFRQNPIYYSQNLIPTFGQPNSDVAITAKLEGNNWAPLIPTGRIAVTTNTQLKNYLKKIKAYDLQQDSTFCSNISSLHWQKQILHLGGGTDASQQSLFQGYLNDMENIIENANYAGEVTRVYKSSTLPLDIQVLNDVTAKIQSGVSLMTFFGHSAPSGSGFEINLDNPSTWNNLNKYPIVLGNSCFNGDIYNTQYSNSENFVNAVDAGAIAFISSVYKGLSNTLALYSTELYRQFSSENYGKTIGKQIQENISYLNSISSNLGLESTTSQMVLNGDPMIKLNSFPKPEIELKVENVSFLPEILDLNTNNIEMNIILTNYGKAITDTFQLEIRRDFPLISTDSIYSINVPRLNYKDTIKILIPLQANISSGINTFYISADIPNFINEQFDELNNNQISKSLFINIDGILPVLPYDFAVVPNDSVTFKASTINPIADFNTYRFEIDTTDLFNSPENRYTLVSGLGGIQEVNPDDWKFVSSNVNAPLICQDSMVYFWRVAINETNPMWREQSFQYIEGKTGWGQDHFFQYKKNEFSGINYNRALRERIFMPYIKQVQSKVRGVTSLVGQNFWNLNGQVGSGDQGVCGPADMNNPAIHVAIIDYSTLTPWGTRYLPVNQNVNNNFGNYNDNGGCVPRVMRYFAYHQADPTSMAAFQNLINNVVPDSNYLIIYTPFNTRYDLWSQNSPSVYTTFANLGSDSINPSRPNRPFIFICKKGDTSSVVETFAQLPGQDITLNTIIRSFKNSGYEESTLIGPASNWGTIYWKQDPLENIPGNDSTQLSIVGFDINGVEQIRIDTLMTRNDSIVNFNLIMPAQQFPFIRLEANYIDTIQLTPSQIDHWHVLYSPLPEAALDDSIPYTWLPNKDTLEQGEKINFAMDIKNIYNLNMDSLLVNYWVEDENHIKHPISYNRQDSLLVGETFRDTIEFTTTGLPGYNIFWMEVNPYVNGSLYITDQPEQQHFNNLLQIPFYVNREEKNPILDVTFDNRHILNGDIVSPKSEILISLKDENPYLVMNNDSDTSLFAIYLTDPDGNQKRIYFTDGNGNSIMQWTPANTQNKRFKINYLANFTKDGKYSILVQGSDRSGNLSGDLDYRISFEVIHASTITYLMNYPNPFSTKTKFVFTLTGSEVPDKVLIQIMNVSGKIVKEINEDELGPIFIGKNITEYSWDGTDNFGDKLANGVYLYTVKAQINGQDIEHKSTDGDTYFKKEFGKMFILR